MHFWKALGLEYFKYLLQYQVMKQKMCKKRCEKYDKLYFFKSPCHGKFKYATIFATFSKTKFVLETENV